jgi:quinolinate synthase
LKPPVSGRYTGQAEAVVFFLYFCIPKRRKMSTVQKTDLVRAINQLRREKNAVILAHYYQTGDIQDMADCVGDSLALAQWAAKTEADIIVVCGVHFMGETAKILSPGKKVLIPDAAAGCSLADSCPAAAFAAFVERHPGHTVISYVNTTAAVKAVTDVVVTSTNARKIVEHFPKHEQIIFGPDRNLGNYINSITGRSMVLWDGACHVHEQFSLEKIVALKKAYPAADVIAHPECRQPVLQIADFIGSTAALLNYTVQTPRTQFIVATESGVIHEMQKQSPAKTFIPAPPNDSTCACNECSFMRLNTMEKLYRCLRDEQPEVLVDEAIRAKAVRPILRMLELS